MNAVDGSDHYERGVEEETPSLLTIILDTNPHAWALLKPTLPLSKAIANLLVFINAHLAFSAANQVAVLASHSQRAVLLYPRPPAPKTPIQRNGEDTHMADADEQNSDPKAPADPNKYRPFSLIEHDLLLSLTELIESTKPDDVANTSTTQMAGALSLSLSYINKATIEYSESGATTSSTNPDGSENTTENAPTGLLSRILVLSVSGDLASQYIPMMNSVFAAQRLRIPIDIIKLAGDTVFLQQASDATKGTYMQLKEPRGLLQYLMIAFLSDQRARRALVQPSMDVVDFRAACFCHQNVVEMGFVCSICLSIFCTPPEDANCLICGTHLALGNYGSKPAVVPRPKKKKKKRIANGLEAASGTATPAAMEVD